MEIIKATISDLDAIMAVYASARKFMVNHNNSDQWGQTYPPRQLVEQDILSEKCHICIEKGKIEGVFYFSQEDDPTYQVIENGSWLNNKPYHVVHRIASTGNCKGVGAYCLNWAFSQCGNLRIDTYKDNYPMQNLLKKLSFLYCGIIYIEDGSPRLAYQKCLAENK